MTDRLAEHPTPRGYDWFRITGDPSRLKPAKRFITDGEIVVTA